MKRLWPGVGLFAVGCGLWYFAAARPYLPTLLRIGAGVVLAAALLAIMSLRRPGRGRWVFGRMWPGQFPTAPQRRMATGWVLSMVCGYALCGSGLLLSMVSSSSPQWAWLSAAMLLLGACGFGVAWWLRAVLLRRERTEG